MRGPSAQAKIELGRMPRTLQRFSPRRPHPAVVLVALAGLVIGCWAWGSSLNDQGQALGLGAPPLFGHYSVQPGGANLLVPLLSACILLAVAPLVASRANWPGLLIASGLGLAGWACAVALIGGGDALTQGIRSANDYLGAVPAVHSPGAFLSHFTERIDVYPTHVRGHPPGMVLVLWTLSRLGLGGSGPAAALIIAVGASIAPAALIATRAVAGEERARAAAPFLVLLPAAIWIATSADAFFAGVGAWAVALAVLAIKARGRRSHAIGAAAGVLFGITAFLSYGLVLLAAIPLAVAVAERRFSPLAAIAGGAIAVGLLALALGFSWFDGFAATREQYLASNARNRPYSFFIFDNIAVLALALGPAVAIGLARLRDRRMWLLVGGALAAVVFADLSGMSKAEVERIWLPFIPWLAIAAAAVPANRVRLLLAAQVALTLAIEITVQTPW